MISKLDSYLLRGKIRLQNAWDVFLQEEKGASDMVAIMVIIVILIGVASIFQEQLQGAIEAVFGKLTTFISNGN